MELVDVVKYFDAFTVCEIRPDFAEARMEGSLLPRMHHNELDAWEVHTKKDTEAVISMAQASIRERSGGLSDLCLAVLKLNPDAPSISTHQADLSDATLVSSAPAKLSHMVHTTTRLVAMDDAPRTRPASRRPDSPKNLPPKKKGFLCCGGVKDVVHETTPVDYEHPASRPTRYLIVPMGFNHMATGDTRPFSISILSEHPVAFKKVSLPVAGVQHALKLYISDPAYGVCQEWEGAQFFSRSIGSNFFYQVVNPTLDPIEIEVKCTRLTHMMSTRYLTVGTEAGADVEHASDVTVSDQVPPSSAQVLCILASVSEVGF